MDWWWIHLLIEVKQGDTLESLALAYLGDASQADLLAQINGLEYPFIVSDPNFSKFQYATGQVNVTYIGTSVPYTTNASTTFSTSYSDGGVRSYTLTQPITFTAQNQTISATVQCLIPGPYGNVLAQMVTVSSDPNLTVTNPTPMTGGMIWNVLVPGDHIIIPDDTSNLYNPAIAKLPLSEADANGGTDIMRTPSGGLQWTTNDVAIVSGPYVIGQDISALLVTPLNAIPDNPTFGTSIPSAIGMSMGNSLQRVAVLAQGAAQTDSRVSDVGAVSIQVDGTWAYISFPVYLNNGQQTTVSAGVYQNNSSASLAS